MTKSPVWTGLLEALGVAAYVGIFVTAVNVGSGIFGRDVQLGPFLSMALVLLLFVTSALICGSIVLGYPIYLFASGEKSRAVKTVLWTAAWLVACVLIVLGIIFLNRFY